MKKLLLFLLTFSLVAILHAATATVDDITWTYQVVNGEAQIYSGGWFRFPAIPSSTSGAITIPSRLSGYLVTSIGDYAFYNCSSLTSVTIPSSVTSIGEGAFDGCSSLPKDENGVQYESEAKVVLIDVPESMTGSFIIPNSVRFIHSYAFEFCSGLTSVTIPEGVTTIGDDAFYGCSNLKITVDATNPSYTSENGALFDKEMKKLIRGPGATSQYTIPSSVTTIGEYAFQNCSGLTSVVIPSSVTKIDRGAFSDCSSLTSVTIPSSVTEIGYQAFLDCSGLTSITFEEGSDCFLNSYAFHGCTGVQTINLPSTFSYGGDASAFGDVAPIHVIAPCYPNSMSTERLQSFAIPENTTQIVDNAFYWGYSTLSLPLVIPASVTYIGREAFVECTDVPSFTFEGVPPEVGADAFPATKGYYPSTHASAWAAVISNGEWNGLMMEEVEDDSEEEEEEDPILSMLTYTISNDEVTITGCDTSASGELEIPSTLGGCPVTSIGASAFNNCSGLTSVTIPSSVTSIGDYAFEYCGSLTSVTIPEGVTTIGDHAFEGVAPQELTAAWLPGGMSSKNLKTLVIPEGVTSIGASAFQNCSGLTSVTIPSSVTEIGNSAFYDCSGLTSVTIPEGVTSIGWGAFWGCSSLTSVVIPEGVTSIGGYAFRGCSKLTSVTIPSSVTSISNYAFVYCSGLTSVTIPSSVTSIGERAFSNCSSLTSVTIPEGVTSIGECAFYYCTRLTSATIPSSVTSIGGGAFSHCRGLTSVTIPSSVTSIGSLAFEDCLSLTSVTISEGVTSIGNYAFQNCSSLRTVTIPSSVTTIGDYAFYGCSNLISVTISKGVTSIGERAFDGCSSLRSVTIPSSVTSIGVGAFSGCSSLTSVTITEGVTSIGESAFYGCSSLTSVTIPSSVTSIGYEAFFGCESLTSVTITEGVTSIGESAFDGCSSLRSVTIPSSVTSIGVGAFCGCESLTSVTILAGVTSIEYYTFSGCSSLTSVTIPSSVISIGSWAFYGCSSLTSVTIPSSVTSIGYEAFRFCSNLTSVHISDIAAWCGINFDSSYGNPLYYAKKLYLSGELITDLVIPEGVTSIGNDAFRGCTGLTSVTIPEGVTYIGWNAFSGCSGLTSVTIPEGVTSIETSMFSGCDNLTSVTIPSSVTTIEYGAFSGCSSLTSVVFEGAPPQKCFNFNDCHSLERIIGYYVAQYSSEWEEVIAADETWNGLTMMVYEGGDDPESPDSDEPDPDEPTVHTPPSWSVSNYQNNMVVYAQVKDITTGAFIESAGSLLGAFDDNGVCRGVIGLLDIGLEHPVYQLTVCSDETSGEVLTLKVWDAATGEITELSDKVTFVSDTEIGLLWEPVVYEIGLKALSMTLNPGWNWCSINVAMPEGTTLSDFFTDWTPQNGDQVKAGTQTATYFNGAWRPTDFVMKPGMMYLIKNGTDAAVTTTVMGTPADMDETIDIATGWNWVGYTGAEPIAAANAFVDNSMFANGDVLKSNAASATFYNGAWRGVLTLTPGVGYKLKVASGATIQYAEPTATATTMAVPVAMMAATEAPDWKVSNYQYNMVVYASIQDAQGNSLEADGNLLAAFDANGVCRGVIDPLDIGIGVKVYQLTVCSDNSAESGLTLKLWDVATETIYDVNGTIDFAADTEIGLLWEPQVYTVVPTEVKYVVTATAIGGGTIAGAGDYAVDEEVTLTATPDEGYVFCGWSTTPVTMNTTYSFTMPEEAVTLTAYFVPAVALNNHITDKKLMSKDEAKQELLDADEVFTADEMKELALGKPVIQVKDGVATVTIQVKKAATLDGEWEVVENGEVSVEITPKAGEKAGFYKFVVPDEQ